MAAATRPHLGVLAFGDSITNGGGELQWGVALQSWALWTARGLGFPYTGYAVDGADAAHVVSEQIPAFRRRAADPEGPYDLGCLYIGVNDVRGPGWDPEAFAARLAEALAFLHARCARVVCLAPPRILGRPRVAAEKLSALDDAIAAGAAAHGAIVVSLGHFGARNHVMTDHVHPTAFGQVAIAQRVLARLAADGLEVRVDPAGLVTPHGRTRWNALRGDWTYVQRDLRERLREARTARRPA
jgi:lysophospholipase L1-like esterase